MMITIEILIISVALLILIFIKGISNNGLLTTLLIIAKLIGMLVGVACIVILVGYIIGVAVDYLQIKGIIKTKTQEEKDKEEIEREIRRANKKIPKLFQMIGDGWRAFLDKNCPKVEWV